MDPLDILWGCMLYVSSVFQLIILWMDKTLRQLVGGLSKGFVQVWQKPFDQNLSF